MAILIDGIRQNDPLSSRGSAVDLNTLTVDDIERIEVVRGSASAAQGSWQASVAQREEGQSAGDGWSRVRSANLGFREQWGTTRLHGRLRLADSGQRGFPDDSGGPAHAVDRALEKRRSDTRQLGLGMDHALGAAGSLEWRLSEFQRNSAQETPRVVPGLRDPFGLPPIVADGDYRRSEAQVHWRCSAAGWELLLGVEHQSERGALDSTVFLGRRVPASFRIHRITDSLVGDASKSFGPWQVQMGLRHERTPGFASQWHPAFGVQYRQDEDSARFGADVSSASKLPSFYALAHPLVGNPRLRPERSRQTELYYENARSSPWQTRVTLFRADYRDLVDFDAGPPPRLVNRASIRGTGVEWRIGREWHPGLQTYAQGTLMKIVDPQGGPPLRYRPRKQAGIGIEAPLARQWRLQSSLTWIGRRFDSSMPTGDVWLGGYMEANASLTWSGSGWQAFAAVDNAFDRKAEETVGNRIPGRRVRAGLRWSL